MVLSHATISTYFTWCPILYSYKLFCNQRKWHWNRAFTRLFFPSAAKNVLGMRLDW